MGVSRRGAAIFADAPSTDLWRCRDRQSPQAEC